MRVRPAEKRIQPIRRCQANLTRKEYQLLCLIRNRIKRGQPAKIEVQISRGISWQERK